MANAIYPLYKQALMSAENNVSLISGALSNAIVITSATGTGSTATLNFSGTTNFKVGDVINVAGINVDTYNGTHTITEVIGGGSPAIKFASAETIASTATVISDVNASTPVAGTARVTTSTVHNLSAGDFINISGTTNFNGTFRVINVPTTTTFDITSAETVSETAITANLNGTFSGPRIKATLIDANDRGYVTTDEYYSAISGVVGAEVSMQEIQNTTLNTSGVFDGDNITFVNVTGDTSESLLIWIDTGTDATSRLVAYMDTGITGLPITPTQGGGDIDVLWNDSGIFRL